MKTNLPPFTILDKISIKPNKIVFYKQFIKNNFDFDGNLIIEDFQKSSSSQYDPVEKKRAVEVNKHNFELSEKASGRIKDKITWLYNLAKTQTITTHNGKILYSFKMNFITLTLPATQRHTTAEITKKCLNQFITECTKRFNMKNYVWRVEFQKNGNVHYHIATDTFIEYWQCRSIWNRCIGKLGYIDDYRNKNLGKTFFDYLRANPVTDKLPFEKIKERFSFGCASGWSNPNTADVRAVTNSKNIAFYIAKYVTKKSEGNLNKVVADREETETNLRLWFCSRSLSKVDKLTYYFEEIPEIMRECLEVLQEVKNFVHDYCEVWYFNILKQNNDFKRKFREILFKYASDVGYFAPI